AADQDRVRPRGSGASRHRQGPRPCGTREGLQRAHRRRGRPDGGRRQARLQRDEGCREAGGDSEGHLDGGRPHLHRRGAMGIGHQRDGPRTRLAQSLPRSPWSRWRTGMNLRWCAAATAADTAARLALDSPRYRDEGGVWWTVAGGRWQTWRADAWHAADPPDKVEGPASDLPAAPTESPSPRNAAGSPELELGPAIEAAVGKIAAAYGAGRLSSDAAEAASGALYAVEDDGGIWTVGLRTAQWHRFSQGRWQQVD